MSRRGTQAEFALTDYAYSNGSTLKIVKDWKASIDAVGDNTGCMALKGGSPVHEGDPRADAWPLDDDLRATASRWGIEPERDLLPQPVRL